MAVLKNNQFSSDDDDTRQARLDLLQANIDTYAVEIAVAGPLLLWAQGAWTAWVDARSGADKELGDIDEAYQEFQLKFNSTREYYVNAKELLAAVIQTFQDADEAQEKYGIMGRTPRTEESLFSAIKQWRKTHDEFVAAADPRVVAEAIVAKMEADADAFDDLWRVAVTEKKEARAAFDIKQSAFSTDTDNLRLVYMLAKMVWGDDDPRLFELGFVPASEIWTPGSGEPEPGGDETPWGMVQGLEAFIDPIGNILINWKKVAGAVTYKVLRSVVLTGDPEPPFPYPVYKTGIYMGSYTDTDHDPGKTYYYSVIAVNAAAEETEPCAGVSVEVM